MKKLLVLSAAILFAFTMNAQKIGVKVGYGMSGYTLNFDSPETAKMAKGLNAGLIYEHPINDMMSLRADVVYNTLGSDDYQEVDVLGVMTEYTTKRNVNYLQIVVSPKFNFGPAYAFVGPYFGYALSDETKTSVKVPIIPAVSTTVDNFKLHEDAGIGDFDNKMDYGLNLGFGVNFSSMFVELNVGYGLANIYNKNSDYYKTFPALLESAEAAVTAGLAPDLASTGYPFIDGTTGVAEPVKKNMFIGLAFGYIFDFGK